MRKLRENLIYALPILLCFDSYCFCYIKTFPVTLSFLAVSLILVLSILTFQKIDFSLIFAFIGLLLLIFMFGFQYKFNITSSMLYVFYFLAFMLSRHRFDEKKYHKSLKALLIVVTIFSFIAVLQMIANFTSLPRFDIVIPNHMVDGFNRYNLVYLGSNIVFARSNGLFLEPSYLSQYCVLSFVIALMLYKKRLMSKFSLVFCLIINFLALVFSFAGTGPLLLLAFLIVYLLKRRKKFADAYIFLGLIFLGLLVLFILPENLKSYMYSRLGEITDSQKSGGMRFSYPYYMVFDTIKSQIFGFGCGNESLAIKEFYPQMLGMQDTLASGYAKIGVELGILGIVIILFAIFKCDKKRNIYFFTFLLMINILGGNLINTYFWCFMMFCNFKDEKAAVASEQSATTSNLKFQETRTTI